MLEIGRLVTAKLGPDAVDRPGIDPHLLAWFIDDLLEHAARVNCIRRIE